MNIIPNPGRKTGRAHSGPRHAAASPAGSASPIAAGKARMSQAHSVPESNSGNSEPSADLLSALSGLEANRERAVAHRTRRVVLGSLGLLNEEKHDRGRARAVAVAIAIVVVLVITPLIWEAVDSFIAGEHPGDPVGQLILWACLACPSLLAAVLVAGWWKRRS